MTRTHSVVELWRAWYEDQPEPKTWTIAANCQEQAASMFVNADEDLDADEIKDHPALVFVRRNTDPPCAPARRVRVTASIEITIWGYPDEGAAT